MYDTYQAVTFIGIMSVLQDCMIWELFKKWDTYEKARTLLFKQLYLGYKNDNTVQRVNLSWSRRQIGAGKELIRLAQ